MVHHEGKHYVWRGTFKSVKGTSSPLLERPCNEQHYKPRMTVYCHAYTMCADVFIYFKTSLGDGEFTEPTLESDLNESALVNMFLGSTHQTSRLRS